MSLRWTLSLSDLGLAVADEGNFVKVNGAAFESDPAGIRRAELIAQGFHIGEAAVPLPRGAVALPDPVRLIRFELSHIPSASFATYREPSPAAGSREKAAASIADFGRPGPNRKDY